MTGLGQSQRPGHQVSQIHASIADDQYDSHKHGQGHPPASLDLTTACHALLMSVTQLLSPGLAFANQIRLGSVGIIQLA